MVSARTRPSWKKAPVPGIVRSPSIADSTDSAVRAFLEALVPWAVELGVSRHLLRALRHQFPSEDGWQGMRSRLSMAVGKPGGPVVPEEGGIATSRSL